MSRPRTVALLLAANLGLLVLLEGCAFLLPGVLTLTGATEGETWREFRAAFHPLLTGEPLARAQPAPWSTYDPWYGFRPRAGYDGPLPTDARGFIGNGGGARGERRWRVFVLGGSTVAGMGASGPAATIPAQLERILGDDFEVVNAGAPGWISSQELAFLAFELLEHRPHVVIALDGYNDLYRLVAGAPSPCHWSDYHHYLREFFEGAPDRLVVPERWQLWRYSYALDLVRRLWSLARAAPAPAGELPAFVRERHPEVTPAEVARVGYWLGACAELPEPGPLPSGAGAGAVRCYVNNVRSMRALAAEHGIAFVAALQPMLLPELRPRPTAGERLIADCKRREVARAYGRDLHATLREAGDAAAAALASPDFLDLRGLLAEPAQAMYVDWCHYSDEGNRVIAERLSRAVLERVGR